jgi:hypothetical protein
LSKTINNNDNKYLAERGLIGRRKHRRGGHLEGRVGRLRKLSCYLGEAVLHGKAINCVQGGKRGE